jgi:dimethylaniline monooxygenase (N-oxide forming)
MKVLLLLSASIPAACRTSQCRTVSVARIHVGARCTQRNLEYPHYLSQAEFQEYIESYAIQFDMLKDIVFNAAVQEVSRSKDDSKWRINIIVDGKPHVEEYDKVVFCHGYQTKAKMPEFEGIEKFEGTVMHCQQFRM